MPNPFAIQPWPRRASLRALAAVLAPACLGLAACAVTNYKSDPISALLELPRILDNLQQMKSVSDIKGSFVFRTADLLFPEGLTPSPEQLPTLSEAQYEQVNRFLGKRIAAVQDLAKNLVVSHPQYRAQQAAPTRFTRVKFLKTGQPEAIVDADGVLLIDVRIVQSILRSVIIHWQRSGGLEADQGMFAGLALLTGPRRFDINSIAQPVPLAEERQAIAAFNRFHDEISKAAPSMEIGMWLKMLKAQVTPGSRPGTGAGALTDRGSEGGFLDRLLDRSMEGMVAEMAEQSRLIAARYAQETFESALDFLIAHELAHQLFAHAAERARPGASEAPAACNTWSAQESAADEFATVLLVQRQLAESRPARVIEQPNGYQQDGAVRVPAIDGGSLFLSTAYRLAEFGNRLVSDGCSYPSAERRLTDIGLVLELAERVNQRGLHYEGLMKGSWTRSRDNTRLAQVMSDEPRSASRNASLQQVERARQLVGPMIEARYRDRI